MPMKEKYYYNGIPLSQYCKENELDADYIRTRIWKKKKSKSGQGLSDDQIVDAVIKACGTQKRYMYNGAPLKKYCSLNDLKYSTIIRRIRILRKDYPDFSDDKIIDIAVNDFDKYNKNYTLYYKGERLIDYCVKHSELNYHKLAQHICDKHRTKTTLTDDEIIDVYLQTEHKAQGPKRTYIYMGIPLAEYARENNLNYDNILQYIARRKDKEAYKDLTDEELVNVIMEEYQPFELKYKYQGISLRQYCLKNDISYYSVIDYIKRKQNVNSDLEIDDLIHLAITTINKNNIIYYYNEIPLKDYAKENGLNSASIYSAIYRKRAKENKPLQQIVNECVETYKKFSIKYYYKGKELIKVCDSLGINYNTIIHRYLDDYAKYSSITVEEAIESIVDYYLEHPPIQIKYYVNDISLAKYCKENRYLYSSIYHRMRRLKNKGNSIEDSITIAIENYEKKLEIEQLNILFNKLKNNKNITIEEVKIICSQLKIDLQCFLNLIELDFTYEQAINLIWYFHDTKSEENEKIISEEKLNNVLQLVEKIKKENKENLKRYDLYDLIGIYKSKIYDSRNEILLAREDYVKSIIRKTCRTYLIDIKEDNFEDFKSEINLSLIKVIDKINSNQKGQIIKFMDLTLKGGFKSYIRKEREQNKFMRLDDAKYGKDRDNNKKRLLIDTIEDENSTIENQEQLGFGNSIMNALSNLDENDLRFIVLKYQENYTNEELSEILHISEEEIIQKDADILSNLRENESIKMMQKSISEN